MPEQRESTFGKVELEVESLKHFYDFFKHLTTVNTGSIVVLAAFMQSFVQNPQWKVLVGVSLGSFVASLLACLVGMGAVVFGMFGIAEEDEESNLPYHAGQIAGVVLFLASITLILAVILLVTFAIKNF